MKIAIYMIPAILLAGCQTTSQRRADLIESAKAAVQSCKEAKATKEFKTWHEEAACENDVRATYLTPAEPAVSDLQAQAAAYRLVLADELDAKRITQPQAELRMAQFTTQLKEQAIARGAAASAEQNQRAVAAAALMQAMPRPQPLVLPAPAVYHPSPVTTCLPLGTGVNCISY